MCVYIDSKCVVLSTLANCVCMCAYIDSKCVVLSTLANCVYVSTLTASVWF